jgi:hypothetical protein
MEPEKLLETVLLQKRICFLLVFVVLVQCSFSQNPDAKAKTDLPYKNAFKGMVLPFIWYTSISTGYERYINKHSLVELAINNQSGFDEMGTPFYVFCLMPGYKYSVVSKAKWSNSIWVGGYFLYRFKKDFHNEDGIKTNHYIYDYGIGISFGKKIFFSRDKSWFLDVGVGVSNCMYGIAGIFSDSDWDNKYVGGEMLARPIVQFGKKF